MIGRREPRLAPGLTLPPPVKSLQEMTDGDIVRLQQQLSSGHHGQVKWQRWGEFEFLDLMLNPEAFYYLPEEVWITRVAWRYNSDGQVPVRLARDYNPELVRVIRSGVRQETTVYTSEPDPERRVQ